MHQDQLFIGIDSGTQGTKVVVLSLKAEQIIAEGYASHKIIETTTGGREQYPRWWTAACHEAITAALETPRVNRNQVKALAVSGQQHGLVALDARGEVIRPAKLWCDTETTAQCRTLIAAVGGEPALLDAIGNYMAVGYTAPKLLWLKEMEPDNYARLHTILLPHDYLNFWLSGELKSESGDASGTAYFDVRRRCWSDILLNAIDDSGRLQACLPEVIGPAEACGVLRPALAESWGLPQGVIVAAGGGDNMMAAIGTGNVKPGMVTASLGTSGTIYAHSDKPVIDARGELAAFCSSCGGWLPLVCTMNVTVATELIRNLLNLDLSQFTRHVAKTVPGAEGLLLLPFFNGERTPALPAATATLNGMTPLNLTPENLCRVAMEGATLGLRYGLEVMVRNGVTTRELRLVGGGAKSPVWRQMVADVFQLPVVSPTTAEAGALGAALQSMWCYFNYHETKTSISPLCDRYVLLDDTTRAEPDRHTATLYTEIYDRYRSLECTLQPLNKAP